MDMRFRQCSRWSHFYRSETVAWSVQQAAWREDKFSGFTPYINGYQNMKRASVLIPIIKKDNSYEILFEVRAKTLRSQPNEIAFPGGKIEKGGELPHLPLLLD